MRLLGSVFFTDQEHVNALDPAIYIFEIEKSNPVCIFYKHFSIT